MLKTLSLSAEDDRGDTNEADEATENGNSESRMLRALEALSSQPPPQTGQPREQNGFRKPQQGTPRDMFRAEPAHHGNKARHRFVRDGEVQVVRAPVTRPRDAAPAPSRPDPEIGRLQALIDDFKLRAEQSERARKDAVDQCRALQTKLAHAELALNDAQLLAQSRAQEIRALQESLAARIEAPPPRPALRDPPALRAPPALRSPPASRDLDAEPARRGPGRPRKTWPEAARPTEPEPVEWWLLPARPKRR